MTFRTSLTAMICFVALMNACTPIIAKRNGPADDKLRLLSSAPPPDNARNRPPNFQTDEKFAAEDAKHGAVLCTWMMNLSVLNVHDQCHKGEVPEFRDALIESIERINLFAAANSATSYEDMRKQADQYLERGRRFDSCEGDPEEFYQLFRQAGAEALRQSTSEMLAVPRPPVMNPCL